MEHGRKWWFRVLLLVAVAVILIVGIVLLFIIMGPEAAESPVLLGILAVIVILATGVRWYIMKDQP